MEFFKPKSNVNFLKLRYVCAVISVILFIASAVSLMTYGLDLGLQFTGGTQIVMTFPHAADLNDVRHRLEQSGYKNIQVQSYGGTKSVMITIAASKKTSAKEEQEKSMQEKLTKEVETALPDGKVTQTYFVGAVVSSQLASQGLLAVLLAMIATMIYIAFRFEWRLSVGAAVALIHDPILILGMFSFMHEQFTLVALSAVLTVIGYSLHDTIVVFDRVRENFKRMRRTSAVDIMNTSINQTMSRTVISSALTFVVVLVLLLFGGPTIHDFALALAVGILVGTYSSIYVAGAIAVSLGLNRKDLIAKAVNSDDTTS